MPSERLEIEGAGNGQNKKTGNGRDERPETAKTKRPETVGTKDRKRSDRQQADSRKEGRRPNELKNFERGILACNTHYDGKGF